jgi:predicted dehydrogenase
MSTLPAEPRTTRRDLLRAAAGSAALAALAARVAPAADALPRVRIGFLGASHSHAFEKVRIAKESADYELVGVAEESEAVRKRYEKLGVRFAPADELLKECAAVAVESDVKDHARHARMALEAGKHVHVEKPPADTLKAFAGLVALAKERKLLMQMGYMWRFNPGINGALEAARKGWLGEVRLVRGMINTQTGPDNRNAWSAFRGGILFELGSHLVDPLVRLLGRPERVTPFLKTHADPPDRLADSTAAVFEFPRALGILTSAVYPPGSSVQRSFEVHGTDGVALVKPLEPPQLQVELAKAAGPYAAGAQTVKLPPYQRYMPELAEFAAAIRAGAALAVTPEEDLLVQESLMRACGMDEGH